MTKGKNITKTYKIKIWKAKVIKVVSCSILVLVITEFNLETKTWILGVSQDSVIILVIFQSIKIYLTTGKKHNKWNIWIYKTNFKGLGINYFRPRRGKKMNRLNRIVRYTFTSPVKIRKQWLLIMERDHIKITWRVLTLGIPGIHCKQVWFKWSAGESNHW